MSDVVVITVTGSDHPGIVAGFTVVLAEVDANILDIAQTVERGIFTMLLFADLGEADVSLEELQDALREEAERQGVRATAQHEDLFREMHRV
ncbi:MAG: hypothetical protein MAG715_00576 [Methanonatronarchaeales archaeon]|nr:hypothetical protein [Methanonatronarchaeales archaeon]